MKANWFGLIAATSLLTACAGSNEPTAPAPDVVDAPSLEDDLAPVRGEKSDTGYLSNLAAEVDAVFTSRLNIDLTDLPQAERQDRLDALLADEWELSSLVDKQIKYAKKQVNSDLLHLNLSSSEMEVTDAVLGDDGIAKVSYEAHVETIVTQEELAESGQTLDDVLSTVLRATLPSLPERMAEDVGAACLEDGEEDAQSFNYFYYYEADKDGCAEAMEAAGVERVGATLELVNLAPSKTVYPEYHRLTEDGQIDVVVFFGAADHDWAPGDWDWGTYQRDTFVRHLSQRGFRRTDAEHGDLYSKTVDGLGQNITVIGPETLKLLKEDRDNVFSQVVRENEVIMYNGHSFYGSLGVLDDPSIYTGRYQIFFMNSCWSYEYYTKQVFKNNVSANDPQGWLNADVVNDTESGWFHNMAAESRILLTNLLRGAETGGEENGRTYDWEGIIEAMNRHAIDIQSSRGTETHEIYGVSGVTTNRYTPGGVIEPDPNPVGARHELSAPVAIPDNDRDGVVATVEVDTDVAIARLTLDLTINHTYRGDLVVTLDKDGTSVTVFDGTRADSPSDDNVVVLGEVLDGFEGVQSAGTWTLKVVDHMALDTGTVTNLALTIE